MAAGDLADSQPKGGSPVGHRVQAVRSVLALALNEDCVFAGLQGGDIAVIMLEVVFDQEFG